MELSGHRTIETPTLSWSDVVQKYMNETGSTERGSTIPDISVDNDPQILKNAK